MSSWHISSVYFIWIFFFFLNIEDKLFCSHDTQISYIIFRFDKCTPKLYLHLMLMSLKTLSNLFIIFYFVTFLIWIITRFKWELFYSWSLYSILFNYIYGSLVRSSLSSVLNFEILVKVKNNVRNINSF